MVFQVLGSANNRYLLDPQPAEQVTAVSLIQFLSVSMEPVSAV